MRYTKYFVAVLLVSYFTFICCGKDDSSHTHEGEEQPHTHTNEGDEPHTHTHEAEEAEEQTVPPGYHVHADGRSVAEPAGNGRGLGLGCLYHT